MLHYFNLFKTHIYLHTYIHTYLHKQVLLYMILFLVFSFYFISFNRCSDILSLQGWKYGFNNFHIYTELISPLFSNGDTGSSSGRSDSNSNSGSSGSGSGDNRDIFILSDDESRSDDGKYCGVMLEKLISFLLDQFPSVKISLRRGGQTYINFPYIRV